MTDKNGRVFNAAAGSALSSTCRLRPTFQRSFAISCFIDHLRPVGAAGGAAVSIDLCPLHSERHSERHSEGHSQGHSERHSEGHSQGHSEVRHSERHRQRHSQRHSERHTLIPLDKSLAKNAATFATWKTNIKLTDSGQQW